jgi:hypothetical protein
MLMIGEQNLEQTIATQAQSRSYGSESKTKNR